MSAHLRPDTLKELEAIRPIFPFENHFIDLPHPMGGRDQKVTAHYLDEGQGEPIVFLHGNPTWSFYFRKVIALLKTEYRCIALDHIGCGLSEKRPDFRYDLESRGRFLERFLDTIGIQRCHLVVHDWGGAIGMSFATRHPERIASLTVTNTAAFPSEWISWRIQLCRLPWVGRWINYHFNGFLGAAMHMTTHRPLDARVKQGYLLPYRRMRDRESIDQFVKDIPMTHKHPSFHELDRVGNGLSQFKDAQILLLWGMRDFCFAPCFLEQWQRRFPEATCVAFEDADHFLFEEQADSCAEQIRVHVAANSLATS